MIKPMYNRSQYRFAQMKSYPNRILWHMNDLCNMECTYCFFPKVEAENPLVGRLSPARISDAFNKTGRQWLIFMGGGEPFLYPGFIELINLLKKDHYIQISTNLFNRNVEEFADCVAPCNIILINASIHMPFHNHNSLRKFIRNYHLFREKGFKVIVSYVTYPSLFSRIKDDFNYLNSEGMEDITALTFQGEYDGKKYPGSYSDEQLNIISELAADPLELLIAEDRTNFRNIMCDASCHFFFMDIAGEVYRCVTIRDSLGNMFNGSFSPGNVPLQCTVEKCNDSCLGIASLMDIPAGGGTLQE